MVEIPSSGIKSPTPKGNGIGEVRTAFTGKASLAMISRPDFYLTNPPTQPKAEIADYVEQNGILVPRRFKTLKEALASGKNFIIRSEHTEELNGASGLLESIKIISDKRDSWFKYFTNEFKNIEGLMKAIQMGRLDLYYQIVGCINGYVDALPQEDIENLAKFINYNKIKKYCEILGLDLDNFLSGISFSYWELLDGYNRTIITDNSIKGRYHIVSRGNGIYNYFVYDNGIIILDGISDPNFHSSVTELPQELVKGLTKLISFYESVRNLERFNPNHCPVIEVQTTNDWENYFLQYHRTRDSDYSSFTLNRPLEDGEIKAEFVRGVTSENGIEIDVIVGSKKEHFNGYEGAFSKTTFDPVFNEIQTKKIKLRLTTQGLNWTILGIALGGHLSISDLFNPKISLVLPEGFYKKFIGRKYHDFSEKTGKDAIMRVRVVSDGNEAYLKILGNNLGES